MRNSSQSTWRPRGPLTALAAAMLLGACSFVPTYERPAAPIADAYTSGITHGSWHCIGHGRRALADASSKTPA